MKLLAKNSDRYQIMDRSRYLVTKNLNHEKALAINNKIFERLAYINDKLYEMGLVKSEIEHKKPTFVGFYDSAICKTENARVVLQLLWQALRSYKVWRAGDGYGLA